MILNDVSNQNAINNIEMVGKLKIFGKGPSLLSMMDDFNYSCHGW